MGAGLSDLLPSLAGVFGYLCLANLLTYLSFGLDKRRAISGDWRLSERRLLMMALVGGWVGAKLAQRRFRHKTRKEPFRTQLNLIGVLQVVVVVVMLVPFGSWTDSFRADTADLVASAVQSLTRAGQGAGSAAVDMFRGSEQDEPAAGARKLPHRFGPGSAGD
jgi:uncharacterized membrane protein YsdA (DUF1294 family)